MLLDVGKILCCGWKFLDIQCFESFESRVVRFCWMLKNCFAGEMLKLRDIQCCVSFVLRNDVGVETILYYWLKFNVERYPVLREFCVVRCCWMLGIFCVAK